MEKRFIRQIALADFGTKGQKALFNASVLIIGAGGLGCPVAQYLAAMGIGKMGIVDFDIVTLSNLHRQVLYDTTDIGKPKVDIAKKKLSQLYPNIQIETYPIKLDKKACLDIIKNYAIIVDCSDNFPTRYMVNDACVLMKKPLVYAAVSRYEGQVSVLNYPITKDEHSCHYRDLYPSMPFEGEVLNCSEAGILGVLPGIIGTLQANEVIKVITGMGKPLINKLLCYNMLNNHFNIFNFNVKKNTLNFITEETFLQTEYTQKCLILEDDLSIDVDTFGAMLKHNNLSIIDVREENEEPKITDFKHEKISMESLQEYFPKMKENKVVFLCQTGKRSLQAAKQATEYFKDKKQFFSLEGGIINWMSKN